MQDRTDKAPVLGFRFGQVASVTPGAAADGNAAITVTVLGTTQAMAYLAAYATPTVGHTVLVLSVLRYPVVLGRVIGLPSF